MSAYEYGATLFFLIDEYITCPEVITPVLQRNIIYNVIFCKTSIICLNATADEGLSS